MLLTTDRAWNTKVQPQLEAQTQIADRADFFSPAVPRIPATYRARAGTMMQRLTSRPDF